jgi:hypothetical protein
LGSWQTTTIYMTTSLISIAQCIVAFHVDFL